MPAKQPQFAKFEMIFSLVIPCLSPHSPPEHEDIRKFVFNDKVFIKFLYLMFGIFCLDILVEGYPVPFETDKSYLMVRS